MAPPIKTFFLNKSRIKTGIDSNKVYIIIILQKIKGKNGIEKVKMLKIGVKKTKIKNLSNKLYVF